MTNITEHFTEEELTHTDCGLPNPIDDASRKNLARLCVLALEPMRAIVGPMHIDSGFRCPAVNAEVGGVKPYHGKLGSAHLYGRAADCKANIPPEQVFALIKASKIPFDQLIWEPTWVHIGITEEGVAPRRQCLKAVPLNGKMKYEAA